MTIDNILDLLSGVIDPSTGEDILRMDYVRDLVVADNRVSMTLMFNDPSSVFYSRAEEACRSVIAAAYPDAQVAINVDHEMISLESGDASTQGLVDLDAKNVVVVASGKGGVGKSTVAVNLAVALARKGLRVGLVDTDVYGPSIPTMFGLEGSRPAVNERRKLVPIEKYGVETLSMGFLVDPERAVVWRGPMISRAVRQFLADAAWENLDFLILDLPPGTGDVPLTITQSVSVTGAVIVSTPQPVALADARRGVAMFEQVQVPVAGIVENMAYFTPPDLPENRYYIFGEGGARRLASDLNVPFLGEIPIEQAVREGGDEGLPIVVQQPDSAGALAFFAVADQVQRQAMRANATRSSSASVAISFK